MANAPDRTGVVDLHELLTLQDEYQQIMDTDPLTMTVEERIAYFQMNYVALIKELGEALDEMSWKPWATGEPRFHRERVVAELVDVLHFLCNMLLTAAPEGGSGETRVAFLAEEVSKGYERKRLRNIQRFYEGYDGVKTKCVGCRRDLVDDVEVVEVEGTNFCGGCGHRVEVEVA